MKKLMALILAAALAFGSSVMVFANEEAAGMENIPFTGTSVDFIGAGGLLTGSVPVLPGQTALTNDLFNFIRDQYRDMTNNNQLPPRFAPFLIFDFTVEESLTTARIDLTALNMNLNPVVIRTLYIDKANNAQITVAQAAAMIEAEEAALAEVDEDYDEYDENDEDDDDGVEVLVTVVEIDMVPLRATAEDAGFTVSWDEENAVVTIANDEIEFHLAAGLAIAVDADGEVFDLETAPINLDGIMFVPVSFFTELLGVDIVLGVTPAVAPVIEDEEEDEDVEEEDEEELEEDDEEDEE